MTERIRQAASIVGLISSIIAIARTSAGVPLGHAIGEGLGWVAVVYSAATVVYLLVCAYTDRRQPSQAIDWMLGAGFFGFCTTVLVFAAIEVDPISEIVGGIYLAVVLSWATMFFVQRVKDCRQPCPECAETVKSAARVCKYCGHRFKPQVNATSTA